MSVNTQHLSEIFSENQYNNNSIEEFFDDSINEAIIDNISFTDIMNEFNFTTEQEAFIINESSFFTLRFKEDAQYGHLVRARYRLPSTGGEGAYFSTNNLFYVPKNLKNVENKFLLNCQEFEITHYSKEINELIRKLLKKYQSLFEDLPAEQPKESLSYFQIKSIAYGLKNKITRNDDNITWKKLIQHSNELEKALKKHNIKRPDQFLVTFIEPYSKINLIGEHSFLSDQEFYDGNFIEYIKDSYNYKENKKYKISDFELPLTLEPFMDIKRFQEMSQEYFNFLALEEKNLIYFYQCEKNPITWKIDVKKSIDIKDGKKLKILEDLFKEEN